MQISHPCDAVQWRFALPTTPHTLGPWWWCRARIEDEEFELIELPILCDSSQHFAQINNLHFWFFHLLLTCAHLMNRVPPHVDSDRASDMTNSTRREKVEA